MTDRGTTRKLKGFVDLQVNGYMGVDFSAADLEAESFRKAARTLLSRGTAAFLPTLITAPMETYRRNLPLIASVMAEQEFVGCLPGIHMEGPFLSSAPGAIGAHDPAFVRRPSVDLLDEFIELSHGKIKLITIAAEVPGAEKLARHADRRGVAVALGHHLAGQGDLKRLAAAGARALTHLGNGLPNMIDRHHNPIWEGLAADELLVTMISDGHHLPESMLRVFLRAKGVDRLAVVSDASPIAGLPPGEYETLGNRVVLEPSGLLRNPEKGCMVGSSAHMLACMNVLASLDECDLDAMIRMGFYNPLKLIGLAEEDVRAETLVRYDPVVRRFELLG